VDGHFDGETGGTQAAQDGDARAKTDERVRVLCQIRAQDVCVRAGGISPPAAAAWLPMSGSNSPGWGFELRPCCCF
jgi:hypothetical protein